MADTLTTVGLSLIVLGWFAQLYSSYIMRPKYAEKAAPPLSMAFVSLYALGALFLTYSALVAGDPVTSGLNAVAVILSVLSYSVMGKTMGKRK
jgi:hypothetical protein